MSTAAERFRRADVIFREAAAIDPRDRDRFIVERCAADARLLEHLQSLFRADQSPEGVLDRPALVEGAGIAAIESALGDGGEIPERLGRYRIIRVIGEGGMGIVYEAEQREPRRRVALKVIRAGMMSTTLLHRFRREAQVLGRLAHPGIARIYEAGTADHGEGGKPFFAMELVEGQPLPIFARSRGLTTDQRLELMARVCDAVHHAHLQGVIHRDLKPANILVTGEPGDASPAGSPDAMQPKILDFGIALAIEPGLQSATAQTDAGQLLGTIAYMSPEQAAGDPSAVDARSDVYALGVIAYELLSGRMPYDVHGKPLHESVRVIREDDPSHLSAVSRGFRGDVETIIGKALEKEKARRYQTAAEFASDIRRHLDNRPIAARPASRLYRVRKFVRRNIAIVTGAAVAFLALSAGTAVSVRQAVVARAAAADARRQAYRACLVAASSALRHHEVTDARRQLEAAPAELRGWEWDHLDSRLDDSVNSLDAGFTPMCMALSPDGHLLASCSSGGKIQTWRVPELAPIAACQVDGGFAQRRVCALTFSADGRELRADARRGSVRFEAQTLTLMSRDDMQATARSADGRLAVLLSVGDDAEFIRVVDVVTGQELFRVPGRNVRDALTRFTAAGDRLLVCRRDGTGLTNYRTADGQALWHRPDLDQITDVSPSTDGARAALASADHAAMVIDMATGRDLASMKGHAGAVTAIAFSPDDSIVATSSSDRTVRFWRAADGAPMSVMHGDEQTAVDMVFAPDGATVITMCSDKILRWWDATAASSPFVLQAPGTVYGVTFSPDGARLAAACLGGDRPLREWNVASGAETLACSEGALSAIAFSPDGARIAVGRSGTADSTILGQDGSELQQAPGHWWRTNWIGFMRGGEKMVSLGNGGRLMAHDLATGATSLLRALPAESAGEGCRAAFSPDQAWIAVASRKDVHLLETRTWTEVATLHGERGNIYAIGVSPDGTRLIAGRADGAMDVWDVAQRRKIATMTGHSGEVFAVTFSPDGKRIASAGRDRTIRIWNAESLEELTPLHGHASFVYCLAFSPDGRSLASGGGDDAVRLWTTRPYREQASRD